ncbi:AI-2E family transporter [Flavobacterium kingsejongi]|uniref:AI-2E family transporter n=1 Tax=Flavobacterium kingsejongi TaxID=1678728 RepID=A0A2S1LRH4_9FLAO|nr:AI-2E family transporter [Flavobacterium kingsejongi]AWG26367.1 AI-2E family transporter [Flavobacterium kingsejongi]
MIRSTPFYTRLAHVLVSIICMFYLAIIGQTVLAPLLFAFLFSLLLLPFANFLERKWKMPRSVSSILVLLSLVIVISGMLFLLFSQFSELSNDLPAFKEQILLATTDIQDWISRTFHIDNNEQLSYVNSATTDALSKGTTLLGHTLLSVSSLMLFLVFIFLYTFFILLHRRLLLKFIISLFREEHSVIVYDVVGQIQYIVKKYIAGLFLQMLIVTTLACTAFEIIGIKYALLLGLITGLFNVIPYIGILTASLLTILITFATMGSTDVLFVLIAVVLIHVVDGNYIMPKIVGSKVKINTLVALLGLVIGELVWGIKGMFLSIPVIAIFKVVFDRVEGLKPWGLVLGEDDNPPVVAVIPSEEPKNEIE